MRAIVCTEVGPQFKLKLAEVASPKAGPGQIAVRIKAAGLNFPDVLMLQGKYQHVPPLPFTPGKELAGVVKEVGDGVSNFSVGDRVCAHLPHGAFAEEVVIPANYTVNRLPDSVEYVAGAAFPLAYSTAMHALCDRANVQSGESVLVLGASGGVGIAALQIAKLLGARTIACVSSPEKFAICKTHGADEVVNYETENFREAINRVTDGRGVDVVCDPVAGKYAEPALRSMAWNGRYCVVGFAAGEIPKIALNLPLLKGCAILGCAVGSNAKRSPVQFVANMKRLIDWIASKKLAPVVTSTFSLEETGDAIEAMINRKAQGKLVMVC